MAEVISASEASQEAGIFTPEEEEILRNTRRIRSKITKFLTEDSNGNFTVPTETGDRILLDQCLNGLDKEVYQRAKIRVATKTADNVGDLTAAIAQALKGHRHATAGAASPEQRRLPANIPAPILVPGETDIGVETFTVEQFTKFESSK